MPYVSTQSTEIPRNVLEAVQLSVVKLLTPCGSTCSIGGKRPTEALGCDWASAYSVMAVRAAGLRHQHEAAAPGTLGTMQPQALVAQ
jgi:hypothetical protein